MYGFDVFSTPERDRRLDELACAWIAELSRQREVRAEALITGHGV